ncbi:MAG: AbrB family transcriptional regulator [Paracoccaceae bacterium]
MRTFRIAGEDIHPGTLFLTFAVGIAGGFGFKALGMPLPMLLGSVTMVGALAILGFEPGGQPPKVPFWLRLFFIPIIGLSIGAAFTPEILDEISRWWPSLVALFLYIPLAHYAGYWGYYRLGGLSQNTAYFAGVPGGLLECIAMGEEAGADVRMLTALQFMRLILTIMLVPLAFSLLNGAAVGSAAGAQIQAPVGSVLDTQEVIKQALICVLGFFAGRKLRMPAFIITGPILASGIGHLTGVITASPPRPLIEITQLVIGVSLGTRFVGMRANAFFKALVLAFGNICATMSLAVIIALLIHALVDERIEAVVLAFAPGGLAEMSLVAISLHISVVYVAAHHVLRIVLSVTVAKAFAHRIPPDHPAQSP